LCEAAGVKGFYFFPPKDTNAWRRMNYGCVCFYYPLIVIDDWIGLGKPDGIGCEPLWRLTQAGEWLTAGELASAEPQSLIPKP
jgi:hypothetical protein